MLFLDPPVSSVLSSEKAKVLGKDEKSEKITKARG